MEKMLIQVTHVMLTLFSLLYIHGSLFYIHGSVSFTMFFSLFLNQCFCGVDLLYLKYGLPVLI